jgi:hypothetical protein
MCWRELEKGFENGTHVQTREQAIDVFLKIIHATKAIISC